MRTLLESWFSVHDPNEDEKLRGTEKFPVWNSPLQLLKDRIVFMEFLHFFLKVQCDDFLQQESGIHGKYGMD